MRKSIAIATALVVGGSAAAAGAGTLQVPPKWYGSDTMQVVTWDALGQGDENSTGIHGDTNIQGEATGTQVGQYLAGGSGAGQGAMATAVSANATQQAAPMSKMMTNGVCGTSTTSVLGVANGTSAENASGIVVAMDAVSIFSSTTSGGASTCNTANSDAKTTDGLWATGGTGSPTGVFSGSTTNQNWKWVLALLYGGLDLSAGPPSSSNEPNCNSTARQNLVNNWSNLFQNSCSNSVGVCGQAAPNGFSGALGHAFRRDDASGTSDVFSSLLGLQVLMPAPSASSNNGFGASPFCNAMNWDTNSVSNTSSCNLPSADQFVGPGGIVDPASAWTFTDFKSADLKVAEANPGAGLGNHHRPPPGAYGDAPISTTFTNSDVLPTSQQDNDPIRRTCLGTTAGIFGNAGEEVCNLDGKLGLVLAILASDWIPATGNQQYPTNQRPTFANG